MNTFCWNLFICGKMLEIMRRIIKTFRKMITYREREEHMFGESHTRNLKMYFILFHSLVCVMVKNIIVLLCCMHILLFCKLGLYY